MSQQVANDLRAARALVERGWCQGDQALDSARVRVNPDDRRAVSWCPAAAIRVAVQYGVDREDRARRAIRRTQRETDRRDGIETWNDKRGRTKAEVLAAFDKAIAAEEAAR